MNNKTLVDSLITILGKDRVLTQNADLDRYSIDALTPFRSFGITHHFDQLADVVVIPQTVDHILQIVKIANESNTPIIPYGSGTGVMGAVIPLESGIILDTRNLNSIININTQDRTATVESGLIIERLDIELEKYSFSTGHDPYSHPIATIGGAISTNGVGYKAGSYGPMGEQVISIEAVLPSGKLITTKSVPKYSSGPNFNHLFIGTEGVFGIITKATIKIFPIPESRIFSTWAFNSFEDGFMACSKLHALGIRPTLMDLTQENDTTLLYLLHEGYVEGVYAQKTRTDSILPDFGGRDIGTIKTEEYWNKRHDSALNYKEQALAQTRTVKWNRSSNRLFDYLHICLPTSKVLEYKQECETILSSSNFKVVEYAIWSRPEMFSLMIEPKQSQSSASKEELSAIVEKILRLAQNMGGIMEYCHGPGTKLNHLVQEDMGSAHDTLKLLKSSIDPNNIMNPSKLGL